MHHNHPIRTRALSAAAIALASLTFGTSSASAGSGGTCDISYEPGFVLLAGDQNRFEPIATFSGSASGWVAPAAMWQWISRDSEPWQELAGGFTPVNIETTADVSRFDLEDTLEFFLGVSLPLEDGDSYTINVAYTSTSDDPSENPQSVLCSMSIRVQYFDTMPDIEVPNFVLRDRSETSALPDTL